MTVDPTNPGQFFACCGLLELADRLWPGAEGWFAENGREFKIACEGTLPQLVDAIADASLIHNNAGRSILVAPDESRCPSAHSARLVGGRPHGGKGSQGLGRHDGKLRDRPCHAFGAMRDERFRAPRLFDISMVVDESGGQRPKEGAVLLRRPARPPNAHCARCRLLAERPATDDDRVTRPWNSYAWSGCRVPAGVHRRPRVYDYFTWTVPLPPNLLLAASAERTGRCPVNVATDLRTGSARARRSTRHSASAIPFPLQERNR